MNKTLTASSVSLLAAILVFSFVLAGGYSFIVASILALISASLFCVFLRTRYSLNWFKMTLTFIGLMALFAIIYVVIVYAAFWLFHP